MKILNRMFPLSLLGFLVFCLGGCSSKIEEADSVFINGLVYKVDLDRSWSEAIAVSEGKIVFVGSSKSAQRYIGPNTQVLDLKNKMVMPGIHDAHTHFLLAGLQVNSLCKLPFGGTQNDIIKALETCAVGLGDDDWLVAGYYYVDQFKSGKLDRWVLDSAFPDRPVYIHEFSAHHGLANSTALKEAGVNAETVDPPGGSFKKNAEGQPTGELVETATWFVQQHIPKLSEDINLAAVAWASRKASSFGITSIQESAGNREALQAFKVVDQSNRLNQRAAVHVVLKSSQFGLASFEDLEQLLSERDKYASQRVETDYVKMWVDGSPTPPYFTEAGFDEESNAIMTQNLLIESEKLTETVIRLDEEAMKVKMHVAGAGAAHAALNAIEAAREANPSSIIRHELGHTNLVIPEDLERFSELNAVAEMSPSVWQDYGMELGFPPRPSWQFKSLLAENAHMTIGTDWPVTVDPNLFPALEGMLDRGDESIALPDALEIMTINGAISLGWDKELGSIEEGKVANFIVLDRNLFEIPIREISETRVLKTIFEGKLVFDAEASVR